MGSYAARQAQIKALTAESLQLAVRQPTSSNRQNPAYMRPLPEIPSARLQLTEETSELKSLKARVAQLSAELKSSNKKLECLENSLTEKNDELRTAVEDRDYFKEQLGMASHHLNNLQSETNHKTIDEFFLDSWRGLLYDVKQCSVQYFENDRKPSVSKKVMVERYGQIVAEPVLYLQSPRLRALLAQAMIWRSLVTHVFSKQIPERGFCWAGRHDVFVRSLSKILDPANAKSKPPSLSDIDLREYHRWRASTAVMLEPKISAQELDASARRVVEAVRHELMPLLGKIRDEHRNSFCNSLFSIVRAAITLDAEMSKQRALLSPFFPDAAFQKDHVDTPYAEYAEIHNDPERVCESRSVHLVIAPGLLKCGSSEGDLYDEEFVIVKSQVSLDRPDRGELHSQLENRSTPEVHAAVQSIKFATSMPAHALGPAPRRTQSTRSQIGPRGATQSIRSQKEEGSQIRTPDLKSGMKRLYRYLSDP